MQAATYAKATVPEPRPRPAELQHLRPSNPAGTLAIAAVAVTTGLGIALAVQPQALLWAAGQLVLALALVQWFVVLHECGHDTLFRTRRLHPVVGRLAGFFRSFPTPAGRAIHGRHHRWTGWQDLDPTTAALVPRPLAASSGSSSTSAGGSGFRCSPFSTASKLLAPAAAVPDVRSRSRAPSRMVRDAAILVGLYGLVAWLVGRSRCS